MSLDRIRKRVAEILNEGSNQHRHPYQLASVIDAAIVSADAEGDDEPINEVVEDGEGELGEAPVKPKRAKRAKKAKTADA